MNIELYLTPVPLGKASFEGKTVAIIDVLRATTSICAALMAGAKGVITTDGSDKAVEMRTKIGADTSVLAGERGGVKIENFQLGNSPLEFTRETVGDKFIIMTTTNGTPLFAAASKADLVVATALVNISLVAQKVADGNRDVVIACAGREGNFSTEDTICGGMLIHLLRERHGKQLHLNDAGSLALLLYLNSKDAIRQSVEKGEHGQFLASLGFSKDAQTAAAIDTMPVLPVLRDGRLVPDVDN